METRLSEFEKNIIIWYPFKNNSSILNLNEDFENVFENLNVKFDKIVSYSKNYNEGLFSNLIIDNNSNKIVKEKIKLSENEKFDYITLIGKYNYDFEEKISLAKKYLKQDGIILIGLDNKFGLKNINNANSLKNEISKNELEEIFKKNNLDFSKFYYVFPNYKQANLICSDNYNLTKEDISRNFSVYEKDKILPLNENETYKEILNSGKNINEFASSFFIEVSKTNINNSIKYVTFSNYRKKEYRTVTVIDNTCVTKKAVEKESLKHINKMSENINLIKNLDVICLDRFENNEIKSKFINSVRFDIELSNSNSIEEFVSKFDILKNVLLKDSFGYNELLKENEKVYNSIKKYDIEKLNKLHFVKNGFIDLVPKNCFLIDGKLNVFDQEWIEECTPVEYIFYRSILNSTTVIEKFGKEELLKALNIFEFIDLFEELEKEFCDNVLDYEIHDIFFRKYLDLNTAERQRNIYKEEAFSLNEKVEKLEKENYSLNLELEDAREKLVNYANELRVISNSGSWKLIQKIRSIISFFNFRNGKSLLDRFYPVGTKRREKYEIKKAEKLEKQRIKNIIDITDLDTANYWLELEKLYKKRIEELDKLVLKPDSEPYEFWMKANDIRISDINYQKQNWNNFNIKPKISIIVPLYNTPIKFFKELLFTIYNQTYPNWELCLADGSPEKLTEIEKICRDSRIKYSFIGENKGISGNSNEALKLATGDFIALLDHDDLLPLNSLYEIVKCINENPDVEFIYTDEDKIESIDKPRYDPHFKPDYAPDFLMSGNYICHFSIFKKELMDKLEGFRSKYDGAQDYDIILRATELTTKIKHISKILYHWRIHPGSTAGNSEAKLYAYEAGEKALQDHLIRIGSNGIAKRDEKINGFYKIVYPANGNPKVNILITNRNNIYYLKNCIQSILEKTTYANYEIDIIDNNSDDFEILKYYDEIGKNEKIKIIKYCEEKNIIINNYDSSNNYLGYANYSKLINFASKKIDGEFIVEIDRHEKVITENWIEIMLGIAQRKEIGCVSPKVYYSNGTIKHAGIVYGIGDYSAYLYRETYNGHRVRDKMICNMSIVSSLCRMYRKEVFDEVNGMNENINFELINENDFSLRIREKGYLNIYTPQVEINDFDIFNERERIEEEDIFEYNREIKQLKQDFMDFFNKPDPYHNINFSPASSNCVVRIDKIN